MSASAQKAIRSCVAFFLRSIVLCVGELLSPVLYYDNKCPTVCYAYSYISYINITKLFVCTSLSFAACWTDNGWINCSVCIYICTTAIDSPLHATLCSRTTYNMNRSARVFHTKIDANGIYARFRADLVVSVFFLFFFIFAVVVVIVVVGFLMFVWCCCCRCFFFYFLFIRFSMCLLRLCWQIVSRHHHRHNLLQVRTIR